MSNDLFWQFFIFIWVFVKPILILVIVETQSNLMWVWKKEIKLFWFEDAYLNSLLIVLH